MVIRRCLLLLILVLATLEVGLGGMHAWAWYQLREARSALEHYHPEEARGRLASCLKIWPGSVQAHLLASRAARQSGDFDEADRQLRACQELLGGSSDDVALEWALLQAANGNPREVDGFLQRRIEQDPALSPLVWEALAEGYIRVYRTFDALACVDYWLQLDPDSLRALELRGLAYQNGGAAQKAAEDLRRVIEREPTRGEARWRLALCLLDMGRYDEALPDLEQVARDRPDDPDVEVRLARCHNMLGRRDQARQILDDVLEKHPEHGLALRTRGQLAFTYEQPAEAEVWLRRAVKVWPNDYQAHYLLQQALQQQHKADEARAQQRLADETKERAERLGELKGRKLSEKPLDPALHYEMGVLLLRAGHQATGVGWLQSALDLDPDYRPAHAALADYYERQGDGNRAAEHRKKSGP